MKKIYLLILSAIISVGSFAQTVVIADNLGTSGNIVVGQSNYHALEAIYTNTEIGTNNYTTAGSAIQQVYFFLNVEGANPIVSNYNVYMKNIPAATTTLATFEYNTTGYTLVFSGVYTASPAGPTPINLTTPFVRTAGSNLQILIIRNDNTLHTGTQYLAAAGNNESPTANSSRRYNGPIAPTPGLTILDQSIARPAIAFNHTFPLDAIVTDIIFPLPSCFTAPQTVSVEIFNAGTLDIPAGAASTTLRIRGANTFTGTLANTAVITPGNTGLINFTGVNLNNVGTNFDTAFVTLAGDGTTYNDTLSFIDSLTTKPILSNFPIVEDVETPAPQQFPVFSSAQALVGSQLWFVNEGDYINGDMPLPLTPRAPGTSFFYFDSYTFEGNSTGFSSRLFSNCIDLTNATGALLNFWMSHDTVFLTTPDSLYVSVSVDKGVTWTRLSPGYLRPDASATTPVWRPESINLAAYLGQTIQIGFEGVSKWGNIIGLDDITITATLAPVSLLSFDAQRNGPVNKLSWKTSQETNSSRFIIERSTNGGTSYSPIGQVAASGNSNTERSYEYIDAIPRKGINYYRLRIIDLDNSFKYSLVRNVKNMGAADLSIAPNPIREQLKIKVDADKAGKGTLTVTDISARKVHSSNVNVIAGSNSVLIDAGKFAPGTYIVTLQLNGEIITERFNKL